MKIIDYSVFDRTIEEHDLKVSWGDTLFEMTKQEKEKHIEGKYLEAKDSFTKILNSKKNDGSLGYHEWALNKALKLNATKVQHRRNLIRKLK